MKTWLAIPILITAGLITSACSDKNDDGPHGCIEDSCSGGKLVRCVQGKRQAPVACPSGTSCLRNQCVDKVALSCTSDTCDSEGYLIKCQDGLQVDAKLCSSNQVCEGNACVNKADTRQATADLLASCDLLQARRKIDQASGTPSVEHELARALGQTFALAQDPAVLPVAKRLGYMSSKASWIFGKGGYFERRFGEKQSCDSWDEFFESGIIDDDKYDKNLSLTDVFAVLSAIETKLLSIADSFEKVANQTTETVSVSEAGCGINRLVFSKADLHTLAGSFQMLAAIGRVAQNYQWTNLSVNDLNYLKPNYTTTNETTSKNKWVFYEQETAQRTHDVMQKLNQTLFVASNDTPDMSKVSKWIGAAASNLARATVEQPPPSELYEFDEIHPGPWGDIHTLTTAVARLADSTGTVDLEALLSSYKFDLHQLLLQPISRQPDEDLITVAPIAEETVEWDVSTRWTMDFTLTPEKLVNQFNQFWSSPLVELRPSEAGTGHDISIADRVIDNSRFSSRWTRDEYGDSVSAVETLTRLLIPTRLAFDCEYD